MGIHARQTYKVVVSRDAMNSSNTNFIEPLEKILSYIHWTF